LQLANQGKARWMIIDEAFDAAKLIEFLQALIKNANKKVFLILDNLRAPCPLRRLKLLRAGAIITRSTYAKNVAGAAALTRTGGAPWSLIPSKMKLAPTEQNVYSNK
jgi:hypothetical protein